jgi:FMN phosphatase YigB (HAD superfamily)
LQPDRRITGAVATARSKLARRRDEGGGAGLDLSVDALTHRWPGLDEIELVSFDVFDTLVVRAEAAPGAVDLIVGARLAGDGVDPVAYARARSHASTSAADEAPGRAPDLDAIMAHVGAALGWDPGLPRRAVRLEQTADLERLAVVPGTPDLLAALRGRGVRIALVSDMHLGADVLGPRLAELGLLDPDDLFLVSCDVGASKAMGGDLFSELVSRSGRSPDRLLHVGNDPWADHAMARKRGVATKLVRTAEPSRYEHALISPDLADRRDLGSVIAGAARQVRLDAIARGEDPALASVVAGVAAPAMIGFTTWVAHRAAQLGLDRLVFLSRNGRVPYEVYRRLPSTITSDLPGSYVHLSRDSVRLASAAADLDAWLDCGHETPSSFLRQHTELLPVSQFLAKLRLDADTVGPVFEEHGFPLDRSVPRERTAQEWRACFDDPRFRTALTEQAEADRELLVEYLRDRGLTSSERIGVVDIGWRGQQAAMMTSVAESASDVELHHFHLGRNIAETLLHPVRIERYLFDHRDPPVVDNAVGLFETMTATAEPGMIGLHRVDGRVEPSFRTTPDPVRESVHVAPLHRIVAEVTERSAPMLEAPHRADDIRARITTTAQAFWLDPTDDEAMYWTELPFERDASGRAVATLGEPVRARDLLALVAHRGWDGRQWMAGSIAVSHPLTRRVIGAARRFRTEPDEALRPD